VTNVSVIGKPIHRRLARVLILLLSAAVLLLVGEKWAVQSAEQETSADASQLAISNASLLNSELQKFRLLPSVIAESTDVAALLSEGAGASNNVNERLRRLAEDTDAAAIYVIGTPGVTLAASNFDQPTSFIGQNYAFRPYFKDAIERGRAELFALGTVSGRPGLYISRRVGTLQRPLGVIVVKIEFDRLAREWAKQSGISMVTNDDDIVIITGNKSFQFRALRPLTSKTRATIDKSRQFEGLSLQNLEIDVSQPNVSFNASQYRSVQAPINLEGGRLITLMPLDRAIDRARAQARAAAILILFGLFALIVWQFRQMERAENESLARRELQEMVTERTTDLQKANALLTYESEERALANEKYRLAREELAQANRLGTLGQVTAGVAHEINQPLAAIRTFSENALTYLGRDNAPKAADSIRQVVALTERIATITNELRGFARRKTPNTGPTSLAQSIDGALLLVGHRLSAAKIKVGWDKSQAQINVVGDRVRLEQVFVNLLQNSLEAMNDDQGKKISISVAQEDQRVLVTVSDNGRGMPEALKAKLFTPFVTGKKDGLGLGLAIVRDIVREFGGDVTLGADTGRGSCFEIELVKA
jgi:two-component system, NtrC family, C4-dicarboxylate transport sensor histidine kinase DctB